MSSSPEPTWTWKRCAFYGVVVMSMAALVTLPVAVLATVIGVNPYLAWNVAMGIVFGCARSRR